MTNLDLTKPIQRRDGAKARFLTRCKDSSRIAVLVEINCAWVLTFYHENGQESVSSQEGTLDIVNVQDSESQR